MHQLTAYRSSGRAEGGKSSALAVNNGPPAVGRDALAKVAAGYMEAFPDLKVSLDQLLVAGGAAFFVWTLTGNNAGPGGTGNTVRVSGIEVWEMGESGLIASSRGYYDSAAYDLQLRGGIQVTGIMEP